MIRMPFFFALLFAINLAAQHTNNAKSINLAERKQIAKEIEFSIRKELLDPWYPLAIDKEYGGFLSTFTFDFKPTGPQDKMIVTQARHLWSNSKAALLYPEVAHYKTGARHGFEFLRDVFWDKTNGGFYTLLSRDGKVKNDSSKTAYGNGFGIYALAAYYKMSKDPEALQLAKNAFLWLEKNSHDPINKGYYQHLQVNGKPVQRKANTPSTSDLGYKDQNSTIHLLEAFTELYPVWPDKLLQERLQETFLLVRDTIVGSKGYLSFFFYPDWTPVSFRDSSEHIILRHRNLDHVSPGHDVETAYLLLKASHTLGIKNDIKTRKVAKLLVDHALKNGWDTTVGGFYDEGYYFKNKPAYTITRNTKNWWAQVEGMNTLLVMADLYPNDAMQYYQKFEQLWKYAQTYLIDHQHGDWYEEGLDKSPNRKTGNKGHIWKATYHQLRALSNCLQILNTTKEK